MMDYHKKAGFPQEKINEIHGAWFDPSNPVVQFSGNLRNDLFGTLIEWEEKADLCLCLGTSLSGMNADRMAFTPAKKANKNNSNSNSDHNVLGTVIINLQRTPIDETASIRIWAKLDDAFDIIMKKLKIEVEKKYINPYALTIGQVAMTSTKEDDDIFEIPYDEKGRRDLNCLMQLNLREDSQVKIVVELAMNENAVGKVYGRKSDGSYRIELTEVEAKRKGTFKVSRLLGPWWIESAIKASIDQIPITNVNPVIKKLKTPYVYDSKTNTSIKKIRTINNNITNNNNNNNNSNHDTMELS